MLGVLPFPMPNTKAPELERTIEWAAATDRVRLGQSTANIYRLELKPINGYSVIVLVSRAGEILRLELPGDVQLINESLIRL